MPDLLLTPTGPSGASRPTAVVFEPKGIVGHSAITEIGDTPIAIPDIPEGATGATIHTEGLVRLSLRPEWPSHPLPPSSVWGVDSLEDLELLRLSGPGGVQIAFLGVAVIYMLTYEDDLLTYMNSVLTYGGAP